MQPFKKVDRRYDGKSGSYLYATPEEGRLIEGTHPDIGPGTVWGFHLFVEADNTQTPGEVNDDGWMVLAGRAWLNGGLIERVREIDAPAPPWR